MSKYKILINLPGSINQGFYSPERGESRWSQNLSYLLGTTYRDQFEVYCWSTSKPQFGDKALYFQDWRGTFWNMHEVLSEGRKIDWDIIFDTSWHHPLMTQFYNQLNSKIYIHGHWGGCCIEELGRFPDNKHIIAYPNLQVSTSMGHCAAKHMGRHLFLPIPFIFPKTEETKDAFDLKTSLMWSIRECFYKRREDVLKMRSLKLLEVIKSLGKKYKIYVFDYDLNFTKQSNEYGNLDVEYVEKAQSITDGFRENLVPVNGMAYDEIQDLLRKSALLFRTSQPPGAFMEFEAISQNCFPLIWKGNGVVFERYYDTLGLVLNDNDSSDILLAKVKYLLEDREVRRFLYNISMQEVDIHYNYNFIVNQLLKSLKEVFDGVLCF